MGRGIRALIGRNGGDRPSSLEGPKKISWMKSLYGVLRGGLWIRFHDLPEFSSSPMQITGDRDFSKNVLSMTYFMENFKIDSRRDIQTPPSKSFKLIEFETCYIEPNPPLFFRQQYMQWSGNMVHSHFTLCLGARDYMKRLSQHPWYSLWMRIKGSHHYRVTTLSSCVKWP